MRNSTRNYVKPIIRANCRFASMAIRDSDTLMNESYEEAFALIEYIFNGDELYEDQIKLIRAFACGKNIYFNAPTGYRNYRIKYIILLVDVPDLKYRSLPVLFQVSRFLLGLNLRN